MFWDDLMRRWRREVGSVDQRMLRGAGGNVAALPAPRRQRRFRWLLWIVAIVLAVVLIGWLGPVIQPR
jgi:ferric-dicitrate binding protein FerR (iron transport regulator)